MRDVFSQKVREILGKRVAFKCSNPKCRRLTIGPASNDEKIVNLGVAAHITAAAAGGPRYDGSISAAERSSIDNGLWLCQSCAKLIDTDITKYSVAVLSSWKKATEESTRAVLLNNIAEPYSEISGFEDHRRCLGQYIDAIEIFCQEASYLSLSSVTPNKSMDDIFVRLRTKSRLRKDPSSSATTEKALRIEDMDIVDLIEECEDAPAILIGEAGSGKSTLIRFIASRAWSEPKTIGLKESHLPVVVHLPELLKTRGPSLRRIFSAMLNSIPMDIDDHFLSTFDRLYDTPIMFLFDALDELPYAARDELNTWLSTFVGTCTKHKILITSRPAGYTPGVIRSRALKEFEVLPFNVQQTAEFAKKWFRDDESRFLKALEKMCPMELRGTPLLLTIAAKVYAVESTLPLRRSMLYSRFVAIWIDEAFYKGLCEEVPDMRMQKMMCPALEHLAYKISRDGGARFIVKAENVLALFLQDEFGESQYTSQDTARTLIRTLSRKYGAMSVSADQIVFFHPTIREYLTAVHLYHVGQGDVGKIQRLLDRADKEATWREVALFTVGILSDQYICVDQLVVYRYTLDTYLYFDEYGEIDYNAYDDLLFAVAAAADNALISQGIIDAIIETLVSLMRRVFDYGDMLTLMEMPINPVAALASLSSYALARAKLRELLADPPGGEFYVQCSALEYLLKSRAEATEVQLLLKWGLGAGEFEIRDMERFDIAKVAQNLGLEFLAWKIVLSVFDDHAQNATYIDIETDDVSHELLEIAQERDMSRIEDYELRPPTQETLLAGLHVPTPAAINTYVKRVMGITFAGVIAKMVWNRDFVLEYGSQYFGWNIVIKSKAVGDALAAVFRSDRSEEWHRAECAFILATRFADTSYACQALDEDSEYAICNSYAREYLEGRVRHLLRG